ncbi:MAG TPA: DNA repair exonuclease [Ramlibacter sp.]|nr:DNA repair exonuclease [Ramlibacter sp.]
MKFLHTADWQIGRTYSQFEADSADLSRARIDGVSRIAQLATELQADAVLVAGDVFDSQTPRDKTILRLFEAMGGYDGPWILLPGNHDAALPESVWQLARRLKLVPANAVLCLVPEVLEVQGRNGGRFCVLPAPLTQRHTHTDLTEWFDRAETPEGLLRIGLAHGSVAGILAEHVDSPNPIAAGRAERARLDYLALGDWHGTKQVDARTWYSGTHEPDRFRTNDSGNALVVEIDGPGALPRVTSVRTAAYRWMQLDLHVLDAADVERAAEALAAIDATTVADVALSGTCDMGTQARLQDALESAERRAAAFSARQTALRLAPTEEDLQALHADGFVGAALTELKGQLQGPQADVAREALLQLARIQRDIQGKGLVSANASKAAAA